jgi:DNA polymerase-3 subunit epsilon
LVESGARPDKETAMREVILDTETTGLDPESGHRVVEIGCIELLNHVPTGRTFQRYLNPEREVPVSAFEIHGLSTEFLARHPLFAEICDEFLAFIDDSQLVIHNAAFDLGFVNAELRRVNRALLHPSRAIDTVDLARRKFPGAQASLDALCRRFGVDNSSRTKHGALLDAELLAEVYLELVGGRQPTLELAARENVAVADLESQARRPPRPHAASAEELAAHAALLTRLKEPIWRS